MAGIAGPADKLPWVGTTIFTVMSALAQEHGAVNLGQGFPDFPPPEALIEAVARHMRAGRNQYAPMAGLPALGEQIARKLAVTQGVALDPAAEITVTAGATQAIFCAIQAAIGPGDEAVLLDPAYDSYAPSVELAGGVARFVRLTRPGFGIDWPALAGALTPRTRLVVINSPHNPSGALIPRGDLDRLAELLRPTPALVLADEVYEHLVYDGLAHASVLAQPELRSRAFAVFSFGKTFNATGWKIGYCVAPPVLTQAFRRIHQYVTFAVNAPAQHALADFLRDDPVFWQALPAFYQARRDRFATLLAGSRLRLLPSRSTYFQLADHSGVTDLRDTDFCRELVSRHGVAAIPLSALEHEPRGPGLIRFCFAKDDATLERGAERLRRL
ncbi:MAG: methionine aminotransferase [Steroidobacteraceae bacterium]